ncbi:MAG: archaeosortase A [Halobacteriota archaeon]|nr:archaeosortase A [Halobacteriota archaeon]
MEILINLALAYLYKMIENVLWIALLFLLLGTILKESRKERLFGCFGWTFFSIYWFGTVAHYIEIDDYFNVVLVCLMAIFCLMIGYHFLTYKGERRDTLITLTRATALICLIYFPFAIIGSLNEGIITVTAILTNMLLNLISVGTQVAPPIIFLGNLSIRIILACTAIESIALFSGVILSVKAPRDRKFWAFMVSVPVIYLMNLLRNVIVTTAYVNSWFGTPAHSFHIAHNVLAKIGSMIILIVIAYAVFTVLPEVLDLIEETWTLLSGEKGENNAG